MTVAQMGGTVVQQGFGSLAPSVVHYFHISKAQLGLSFTAIMLGSALTVALGGAFVDRFGERNVTIFAGCGVCASLLFAALVPSYPWLVAWLFVMGLTYATLTPAGGRAILAWFERDRGFAMSIRQMGVPIGAVLGGLIMPAIAVRLDYQWALAVGGVCALLLTAGSALFYHDPEGYEFRSTRLRQLLGGMKAIASDRRTIWLTATCAILAAIQQIMNGFLALTATSRGSTTIATAALVFVTGQAAAIVGRAIWGKLSDAAFHDDRVIPIALMCVIVVFAGAGLALTEPGRLAILFASGFALGFAAAGWNGLFAAAMAEIGGPRFAGSALGVGLTAIFFSGALGPWAFGAIADEAGIGPAWWCVAASAAIALVPSYLAQRAFTRAALQERASLG